MPSQKISEMPAADTLTGAELLLVVQGGVNKQTTVQKVSEKAAPTEVSQLANDVPYCRNMGSGGSGNVLVDLSPSAYKSASDITAGPDGLLSALRLYALEVIAEEQLFVPYCPNNQLLVAVDGILTPLEEITALADGTFGAVTGEFSDALDVAGGLMTVNDLGELSAAKLSAGDGFTGTGAFTNFTIVDGIITAAS